MDDETSALEHPRFPLEVAICISGWAQSPIGVPVRAVWAQKEGVPRRAYLVAQHSYSASFCIVLSTNGKILMLRALATDRPPDASYGNRCFRERTQIGCGRDLHLRRGARRGVTELKTRRRPSRSATTAQRGLRPCQRRCRVCANSGHSSDGVAREPPPMPVGYGGWSLRSSASRTCSIRLNSSNILRSVTSRFS
jgi:hypothetical protein